MTAPASIVPRRSRAAVSVLFFVNGALLASYVPRLPVVKDELDLTNAALGAALAFAPVGALATSSVAGRMIARVSSGRLAVMASVVYGLALPLIVLAPTWVAFAGAILVCGVCDGLADVAQNAHGLRVQQKYGRSLINGFHAWWSIGGVVGGLTAAGAAALDMSLTMHLGIAGGVLALTALGVSPWTLREPDPGAERVADAVTGNGADIVESPVGIKRVGQRARWAIATLGGVAGLSMLGIVMEDVPGVWGAIYLTDDLGAVAGLAALAYAAVVTGMTVGRLAADRAVDRWGHLTVVRTSAGIGAAALAAALAIGTPEIALVGFVLVGLGVAPALPALFHAAGHRPGIRPASGVAVVSWSMRIGLLIAPLVVGVIADTAGLTWALSLAVAAGIGIVAGASVLRTGTTAVSHSIS